jgi:hypothetical protein
MVGSCPGCGLTGSIEVFLSDPKWKEVLSTFKRLPSQVQGYTFEYLALFRPNDRSLTAKRTQTLLSGLADLVCDGSVRWDSGELRPADARLWAEAMAALIERRPKNLTNHNYLRHVAWDRAKGLAAEAERRNEGAARHRTHMPEGGSGEEPFNPEDPEIKEMFRGFFAKVGGGGSAAQKESKEPQERPVTHISNEDKRMLEEKMGRRKG